MNDIVYDEKDVEKIFKNIPKEKHDRLREIINHNVETTKIIVRELSQFLDNRMDMVHMLAVMESGEMSSTQEEKMYYMLFNMKKQALLSAFLSYYVEGVVEHGEKNDIDNVCNKIKRLVQIGIENEKQKGETNGRTNRRATRNKAQ